MSGAARSSRSAMQIVDSSDGETTDLDTDLAPANVKDPGPLVVYYTMPTLDLSKPQEELGAQCADVLTAWAKNKAYFDGLKEADNEQRDAYCATVEQRLDDAVSEVNSLVRKLATAKGRCATRRDNLKRARDASNGSRAIWDKRIKKAKTSSVAVAETLEAVKQVTQCPINHTTMADPAITADGHTYDSPAIKQAFANNPGKSPMSNARISENLTPNRAVRNLVLSSAQLLD